LKQAQDGQLPWYQVLEAKGFQLGRTDPLLDPKGKKTIYMFELASQYYHRPGLMRSILGSTENPKQVFPEESLLAQLTSGQIDAIVAYKHEAVEWGVPYITLPPQINLGSSKFAKYYQQASFKNKDGKLEHGSPIVFTITIPATATNESGAEKFVRYMVSGEGHALLIHDGFIPMQAMLGGSKSAVPSLLRPLIQGTWSSR
jgi:molybdate/tungstate transport system substrate-binding protein